MLVAGLASGVHCLGMCGGIVGAFAAQSPIALTRGHGGARREWARQLAFNAGRVASYAAAGALAGTVGGAGTALAGVRPAQTALFVLANLMLIVIGLYIAGAGRLFARIEALGAPLWRRLQPYAAKLLPARSLSGAFAAGALWGWIPCGLVYGALAAAVFAGTAQGGALAMLAFGVGTLPNLLIAGFAAARLKAWVARRGVRVAAGMLVMGFGVYGILRASGALHAIRSGLHGLS
jgi:sulfite exporter TauE/SafE